MKENDLDPSLMSNMSKCSFLFVNYIYLIYFTVFNLINHKLLQDLDHVNMNHMKPGTVFTFCLQ